jgi:hypothetical protein
MSDGTPIDSLESGDVTHAADASRVQAILQDMNASGADMGSMPQSMPQAHQMMPPIGQMMPPMMPQSMGQHMGQHMGQQQRSHYVPIDDDERKPMKKNFWSTTLERIRDPLFVSILVFVLSLPVLHTLLGKYASWAFAVGGQLSWLGLISLSLLSGLLFGTYKTVSDLIL